MSLPFAVFYLPFRQPAFRTERLSPEQWLGVIGLSSIPLVAVEAAKLSGVARRLERDAAEASCRIR